MTNRSLTVFQGRAGDHNDLAIPGAAAIGHYLSKKFGQAPCIVGHPEPALNTDWKTELDAAMADLQSMAARYESIYRNGKYPVTASSRCAVSLATLPVVAKYHPGVRVVWFDSHADLNTPETSKTGYLGGLALAGSCGLWDSGLGSGINLSDTVLVGVRDVDPEEQKILNKKECSHIPPTKNFLNELDEILNGGEVYVHIDCDVLNPDIVPTDYRHAGGFTLEEMHKACSVIAKHSVVGFEIAEFQNAWETGGKPVSPAPLLNACAPLFDAPSDV